MAALSAREVAALAYTVGRHIVFDAGQYRPRSAAGRRLLAHELAHVVQQSAAPAVTLRRAEMRQGAVRVHIDYGPIIFVTAANRPDSVVALMATLIGVLILGVLGNGLTQMSIDSYVREVLIGTIIVLAVASSSLGKARG